MTGMTVIFVHGVPETSALWEGVRAHLDGDSIAVDLPGFGTPRPAGFGATKDARSSQRGTDVRPPRGHSKLVAASVRSLSDSAGGRARLASESNRVAQAGRRRGRR
jgi:pimeloyl-ACP methyl ester carboxylesterase